MSQPRTLRLPWNLYTTLAVLISNYTLVPNLADSLLLLALPLMPSPGRFMATEATVILVWFLTFWWLSKSRREGDATVRGMLGLTFPNSWRYYLIESMVAILAAITLIYALTAFKMKFGIPSPADTEMTGNELRAMTIIAVAFSPILEELVFRGFLQSTLSQYTTVPGTIVLTSAVFLLFHTTYYDSLIAVLYVFCLGLLLSYFRYRTGSVVPGMLAHLANNALAMHEMLKASGH